MSCNKVDDPDASPQPNGCGPEGWGEMVPDNPTGCEDTSFLAACNEHDICYGTCGSSKDGCDSAFLGEVEPLSGMLGVCVQSSCAVRCSENVYLYYGAVHNYGESAYESAQIDACACCDCN